MSQALETEQKLMTVEEYLAFEERSKRKHEYMNGEIFLMAGVKRNHSTIAQNVSRSLGNQLENNPCEVHGSDIKVLLREGHFVYPDVSVACGEIVFTANDIVLLNPAVVFEVLSKSTESRDRGEKREDYMRLQSLRHFVMVAQNRVCVEHYSRQENGKWLFEMLEDLSDVLVLESIGCQISLRDIYARVTLKPLKLVRRKKQK